MLRLEDLQILVETLDRGSLSAAAARLGLSKQMASRRIAGLEAALGARLLQRTTRRLSATELGLDFAERARHILAEAEAAEAAAAHAAGVPRGRLRISAPVSFGTLYLAPILGGFLARHPALDVEIDLDDRQVDLVGEGYDMAVRLGRLADSSLVARRIYGMRLLLCASPAYLAERGSPGAPADLRQHDCLIYNLARSTEWRFGGGGEARVTVTGRLRSNNGEILRDAAVAGLGIVRLPAFLVADCLRRGALTEILPDWACEEGGVHVVYPRHRQASPAIRAFVDYVQERLGSAAREEAVVVKDRVRSSPRVSPSDRTLPA